MQYVRLVFVITFISKVKVTYVRGRRTSDLSIKKCIIILYYRNQARNDWDILKFYSMEQEISHYFRGKLHVGQITVRRSARSTT